MKSIKYLKATYGIWPSRMWIYCWAEKDGTYGIVRKNLHHTTKPVNSQAKQAKAIRFLRLLALCETLH
jgi:hypothetical protein